MPYTPPARSPAASRPESPPRSCDGPGVKPIPSSSPFISGPELRPNLPRSNSSTTYLHKHRRSPSSPDVTFSSAKLVQSDDQIQAPSSGIKSNGSIRQSPPPLNNLTIPTGAVMSPPDSGQNSSDDEATTTVDRGRRIDNLAELHAAIESIEKEREMSPTKVAETNMARNALSLDTTVKHTKSGHLVVRPPLSKEARKISHSRSATESDMYLADLNRSHSYSPPGSSSDSELDDETASKKPPMLRKKSGELVRPALRPASARRRPSSMPGTPTFGKNVHFSNDLEHVRHFLQVDKPLAVSVETSPVETYESETEFPFQAGDKSTSSAYEWDIRLANFAADMSDRSLTPVKVERVFLSPDKKTLIGTVAVQNLAFHKSVIARFTFDYWKTTSEVSAEFSHDVRRQNHNDGLDRFNFQIRIADQVNLESKTLFFCVRYTVGGQEFWDSNNSMNFQVDFSKKQIAGKVKQSFNNEATRHLNGLPRSRSPRESPNRKTAFDDFSRGVDAHWDSDLLPRSQSASSFLDMHEGATPLKFRNKTSRANFAPVSGRRDSKAAGQAFGHRYDFGASLSAAISAASTVLGEQSGLPQEPLGPKEAASAPKDAKPVALIAEKPPAQSQSYNELLEKYCFFGNGKLPQAPAFQKNNSNAIKPKFYLDGSDSASMTPSPAQTPPSDRIQAGASSDVERASRSGAASPSFGYPYHSSIANGLPVSTAIQG